MAVFNIPTNLQVPAGLTEFSGFAVPSGWTTARIVLNDVNLTHTVLVELYWSTDGVAWSFLAGCDFNGPWLNQKTGLTENFESLTVTFPPVAGNTLQIKGSINNLGNQYRLGAGSFIEAL